jgi:phosphohistidine phosphatase
MKRLILMRHAKAEPESHSGRDFDRALTERGLADALLMGRVLGEAGFTPDVALVSSALRTRQTWEQAGKAWGAVETVFQRELFHAPGAAMLAAAEARPEETVMLVGHNPGTQGLALRLLGEAGEARHVERVRLGFPTAAAAVFRFEDGGAVACEGVFRAKDHGGGA